jgi:lipoyl(octanoyl) transferase
VPAPEKKGGGRSEPSDASGSSGSSEASGASGASPLRWPEGTLEVRRLGRTPYAEAHALQEELVAARLRGDVGDLLLLTEHDPVITVGRGRGPELAQGCAIPVIEVERGGEATYHGPGQLVAYPIYRLAEGRRDLHRYLRDLEEVVIRALAEVDVAAERRPGLTGVWAGGRKLCSIGVAVRRWVAWHGLALNLSVDLGAFRGFRPCGLDPEVMGNVADLVEVPPARLLYEVLLIKHFCEVFELELPPLRPPKAPPPGSLPIFPN